MSSAAPTIAVYGVGRYGTDIVRMATAKGWPVVAAYNRAGPKVGHDVGRLAGLDQDLGVVVEDCDAADFAALNADIAIVATTDRLADDMDAFERLLGAGVNVLSHNTESYLPRGGRRCSGRSPRPGGDRRRGHVHRFGDLGHVANLVGHLERSAVHQY